MMARFYEGNVLFILKILYFKFHKIGAGIGTSLDLWLTHIQYIYTVQYHNEKLYLFLDALSLLDIEGI